MERINALGEYYDGYNILPKELLAETDDAELQAIVEKAAAELDSPIALVSLMLDQTQFFKAHVGLPDVLVAARGTHRDASFCQFVVRDGQTFEVNDAPNDVRIPQHVVTEFNIQAYLGMPIKVEDAVVGALCVLDTKARTFTEEEREQLRELSELVNLRLAVLTQQRRQAKADLTYRALPPVLAELSDALEPVEAHINASYAHLTSIKLFLDFYKHTALGSSKHRDMARLSCEAAAKSHELLQDFLEEIEMSVLDVADYLTAIKRLVAGATQAHLSEVVTAAQDIARHATKLAGGFVLPDFLSDPIIYTKGDLAVALVSNCLLAIATELSKANQANGIDVTVVEQDEAEEVVLHFEAEGLDERGFEAVFHQLDLLIGNQHPSIVLRSKGASVQLSFKIVPELQQRSDNTMGQAQ